LKCSIGIKKAFFVLFTVNGDLRFDKAGAPDPPLRQWLQLSWSYQDIPDIH
jgi:hypothetical protein